MPDSQAYCDRPRSGPLFPLPLLIPRSSWAYVDRGGSFRYPFATRNREKCILNVLNSKEEHVSESQKNLLLLKPRGFCAGVVRAIDIVRIALEAFGPPIYVRKEIVHNRFVVEELQ